VDQKKLSDWLQIVGMFGVNASLLFVGLQMKQSDEIALSATYQARTQMAIDQYLASSGNPQFTSATAKLYSGESDTITREELVALEYNFAATVVSWENQHYQFESGFLPEEHWRKNFESMRCMFSSSIYQGLLEGWVFRPSFQKILDEANKSAAEIPDDCWSKIVLPPQ